MTTNIRKRPRSVMPVISTENISGFWNEYKQESSKKWWRNTPPKRLKSSKKEKKKPPAGKVQCIRLYPTQNERLKLRKWIETEQKDLRVRCINVENFKNDTKLKWFRSKKDPQQLIVIHSQHWGRSCGEYSFLPKIKSAEPLPEKLGNDSRLVMNCLGEFYLCIPKPLEIRTENQERIRLDPGVRTFMTDYDPSGIVE
ncbi:hypothetical protein Glove_184g59 [Diversispora epigaea]|uniref:Uncharacterized protein n=1 Tax=Diversispora epigaea TaxID=1348612 RepID=A0A397ITV8_9GLOM|nr:hypothetical protein Glove_184g59 [Diversispora epigaea]